MEMLDGVELTLDFLNEATQAWAEIEYNRAVHRELSMSPVERLYSMEFVYGRSVVRSAVFMRHLLLLIGRWWHLLRHDPTERD